LVTKVVNVLRPVLDGGVANTGTFHNLISTTALCRLIKQIGLSAAQLDVVNT